MDAAMAAFIAVIAGYTATALVILESLLGLNWKYKAWTGVVGIGVAALASVTAVATGVHTEHRSVFSVDWLPSLGVEFALRVDTLSAIMGLVVAILSLFIALYSVEYIGEWGAGRYWIFYTFFVSSMLLLVYADDLIAMFIGWEGTGISSWALIGFYFDDREEAWVGDPGRRRLGVPMWFTPTHSALRAISFTRVGDIGMLIGIGVVYALLGTVSISTLAHESSALVPLVVKGIAAVWLILFYLGALAKSAQFPFHEWLVTAMTGPTSVSALIHAATMVKAGVYFALRLTPILAPALIAYASVKEAYAGLAWLSLFTAFATATMALVARELKLVLAYSTASQLSYMLAAVFAAAAAGHAAEGVFGGFAHLVSHAVFKAALFLVAGAVIHAVHSRYMDDMGGLKKYMPLSFVAFLLAALSLAALPPFSGWWSKDAAVHAISLMSHKAAVFALITAVLTAIYTSRMLYHVFLGEYRGHGHPHEPGKLMLYPYFILGIASLGLGLAWPWIEHYIALAAGLHEVEAEMGLMVMGTAASILGLSTIALYMRGLRIDVESSPTLRTIKDFLYDRWFLNAMIYRVIVYPGKRFAELLSVVERALDRLAHEAIPAVGLFLVKRVHIVENVYDTGLQTSMPSQVTILSEKIRSLQSGDMRDYLTYFVVGVVLAAVISAFVIIT